MDDRVAGRQRGRPQREVRCDPADRAERGLGQGIEGAVEGQDLVSEGGEPGGKRRADKAARSGHEDRPPRGHTLRSAMLAGSKFARRRVCWAIRLTPSSMSRASSARTMGGWLAAMSRRLGWATLRSAMI